MTGRLGLRALPLGAAFLLGLAVAPLLVPRGAEGRSGPADFATVVASADGSVAHVTTLMDGEQAPRSRDDAVGAGFVYAANGLIVTSRHILQGAKRVFVSLAGHEVQEAQIVGVDDATDVALLRVNLSGLRPLPVGDAGALRKGEWVLAAGSPFHLPRSFSVGIVSGLARSGVGTRLRSYEDFIQTDAAANVGNSGGPLLNASGEVVGMMTAILSRTGRSQGVGLAVPVGAVLDSVRRLQGGGAAVRPSLGVVVREQDPRAARTPGLEVTRFLPNAPGREAGLQVGDVILEVGGVAVPRIADLQRAVWAHDAGTTLPVVFLRAGRRYVVQVRLR
jgi:serine protease Do